MPDLSSLWNDEGSFRIFDKKSSDRKLLEMSFQIIFHVFAIALDQTE